MSNLNHSRNQWPRLLCALPASKVKRAADHFCEQLQVQDVTLPQSGLALLKLCDGALGDEYFIGESPLAQASVTVTGANGARAEGAAQILDDRVSLARSIAILDAVLSGNLPGSDEIVAMLDRGEQCLRETERWRKALLAKTRVDFSLLGEVDEEGDDA